MESDQPRTFFLSASLQLGDGRHDCVRQAPRNNLWYTSLRKRLTFLRSTKRSEESGMLCIAVLSSLGRLEATALETARLARDSSGMRSCLCRRSDLKSYSQSDAGHSEQLVVQDVPSLQCTSALRCSAFLACGYSAERS